MKALLTLSAALLMNGTSVYAEHRDAYRSCILSYIDAAAASPISSTILAKRIVGLQCGMEALEFAQILSRALARTETNLPERHALTLVDRIDLITDALAAEIEEKRKQDRY